MLGHASPSDSSPTPRRFGLPFPLLVFLVMALGVGLVYILFIQANLWIVWYTMKPGLLVTIAEQTGRLEIEPLDEVSYWYEEGINVHSRRWATTLLFLGLHDVTGLEMSDLTRAPFGIVIFLFALLFLFASVKDSGGPASQWGFLLASLLFLLSYWSLGWIYHSGDWPALTMVLIMLGLIFRAVSHQDPGQAVLTRALLLLFVFLNFWTYHGTMMLMVVFFPFLLLCSSAIPLISRARGLSLLPRPSLYQTLALVALAVFFVDPLSTFILATTGVLRPWNGPQDFVSHLTQGSGNYASYLVGYPPIIRAALVAQVFVPFVVATWLWISDHLIPLLRKQRLSETDIVISAIYLSVPLLLVGSLIVGQLRTSEANFLLIIATSLLLARHFFRGESVSRGRIIWGSTIALGLVVMMASVSLMHVRDPITRYANVQDSDAGVAQWASEKIDEPYFADIFFIGLILMNNVDAEIVPLHGDLEHIVGAIYDSPLGLAGELESRGAQLALLNDRMIDKPSPTGVRHALGVADFFLDPIPDYDYGTPDFAIIYDNGDSRVITLPPSEQDDRSALAE